MTDRRNALTPDALAMVDMIARTGSFAAAARELGKVPSALTYSVRQLEEALDVLLFDRRSRQARLDAVANRVRRVATGWESQLTLSVDTAISRHALMELAQDFFEVAPQTRLRLREEALSGTLEALVSGQADLALGVALEQGNHPGIRSKPLGELAFVFAVAPHHPLARAPEPLSDEALLRHRAVAVADSVSRGDGLTVGLLPAEGMAEPWISRGLLVVREVERPQRVAQLAYAWRIPDGSEGERGGRALQWWLKQLKSPATRQALLLHPKHPVMANSR